MKKSILVIALSVFITGAILTSCNRSKENVVSAKDMENKDNKDLNQANKEYLVDIEKTKSEAMDIIKENEKRIAEFDARIQNEKATVKAEYKEKVKELEQKNSDLKRRLDEYNAQGKVNWADFKDEFNRDLNELKKEIADFKDINLK